MTLNTIIGISAFLIGFFISFLIFQKRNTENALLIMLNDFKQMIIDYKNQAQINTKEISNAISVAQNLSKTLTTNQNIKGKFGEDCLERIIQFAYPTENIDYIKQYVTKNTDEKEIKPDFIINLPNNKSIIIDCKLNLEKFIEYNENKNTEYEILKKNELIKDLNNTINSLSNKHYENSIDLNQAGFILMYIPLETVLTSIYTDKDFLSIVKSANEKNIILVGNSSILTVIRLVKLLWAQNAQEKNVDKIVNIAENIYKYISIHTKNLHQIKEQLELNIEVFNKEYEKMTDNKLFNLIEELRQCGIQTTTKKIGKKLEENKINSDFLHDSH